MRIKFLNEWKTKSDIFRFTFFGIEQIDGQLAILFCNIGLNFNWWD